MNTTSKAHRVWWGLLIAAATPSWPLDARAEGNIGVASVVRNDVTGVLISGTIKVDPGASVFSNEIMKTAADSSAKIVFTDSTNLAVGPNSTVKLNHFVFSGPSNYGKAAIEVAKGAFRFTTGHSDKRAYEFKTGVASLSVRGTIFEVLGGATSFKIHVVEGTVDVTTNNGKVWVVQAGQSMSCTATACTTIPNFDLDFPTELTEVQDFSQVAQAGEQGFFASDSPIVSVAPIAAIAGGAAAAAGVSAGSQSNWSQQQELQTFLLFRRSPPSSPPQSQSP